MKTGCLNDKSNLTVASRGMRMLFWMVVISDFDDEVKGFCSGDVS